ncbi:cell division protein FtsZ [Prosthecochloris sp. N3]|uniref:Cell division protein FtsZ n=1 Tax=Prosthecochloris ethylica TaxID=2743976 RepID=A0ABR9XRE2_9CHLB|nr:cell division protein FtsZ [Prosthecochloris ethylica]MBF0586106.1 cell division protein FtsZ [Prosthecochloris ethylica]MBF0636494.1 cell division protein FtsZ [Prosthecochloris ethylica]NUK47126.1 cell division protein FtsZ [Prosthecochloris ethylica]
MAFELDPGLFEHEQDAGVSIKIVGVGGCGGNAVNNMIDRKIAGVDFIAFNTDRQALLNSKAPVRIQIGKKATNGLGAGADPAKGRQAAEDDREVIAGQLRGADLVFITAGMGKGTGTGATPVIASIARNMGILTIGVVTRPFSFEGRIKAGIADSGISELRKYIDTLIIIENERILSIAEEGVSATEAFNMANDVLYRAAKGIADIITQHGHVNVDFADVRSVMSGAGDAVMGSASASGERRALKAASDAITSPLLEGYSFKGAKGVLVNMTGDVTMRDMSDAMNYIEEQVGKNAKIINGYVEDEEVSGEIRVTVIVTGFNRREQDEGEQAPAGAGDVPGHPAHLHHSPFAASPAANSSGYHGQNPDDLRVPAYIRRRVSIHDPRDVGSRQSRTTDDASDITMPSGRPGDERIRKGETDTPAYLRRRQ